MSSLLPARMRAVVLTGHGGLDRLLVTEVPIPEARAGEVLIAVGGAALNHTDVNLRLAWYAPGEGSPSSAGAGGWQGGVAFPLIQGADVCGRIVAVGAHVDGARIGERVLVDPVLRPGADPAAGLRYLGSDCDGGFAEYVRVPAVNAWPIRSTLSDVELASFPCSYTAAENMLGRAAVSLGERVLVTGASGGVGSAVVQLAHRRGAHVTAVASPDKWDAVLALGASRVVARDTDFAATLGAAALDVVIDVVGGAQFPQLLNLLRRGGRCAVAGAVDGARVNLDLRRLYLNDLTLFGCTVPPATLFADLVGYIERREIAPVVAQVYPLAALPEAQRDFLAKRHTGKLVVKP